MGNFEGDNTEPSELESFGAHITGELATDDERHEMESRALALLKEHGVKETEGQYGYRVGTSMITFTTCSSQESGVDGTTARFVLEQLGHEDADEGTVLLDVTFAGDNRVTKRDNAKPTETTRVFDAVLSALLDISALSEPTDSERAMFAHIVGFAEEEHTGKFWEIETDDGTIKHIADIIREHMAEKIDVYVERTSAGFADENRNHALTVSASNYIGNTAELDADDFTLPYVEIIYEDRQQSIEFTYSGYLDGDYDFIETDLSLKKQDNATQTVSLGDNDFEDEGTIEEALQEIGLQKLSKHGYRTLMKHLMIAMFQCSELPGLGEAED